MSESLADYAMQHMQDENMNEAKGPAFRFAKDCMERGYSLSLALQTVKLAVAMAKQETEIVPEAEELYELWVREAYEKAEKG